jgi:hypothetical protein
MNWLLHLWAHPPIGAVVPCPPPLPGNPPSPGGLYDPAHLTSFWNSITLFSFIAVLLLVVLCYQLPRSSLGPRFVRGWWIIFAFAGVAGATVPALMGIGRQITVRAGSCSTHPSAFLADLPYNLMFDRIFAGAIWGMLTFVVLSLIATRLLGMSRHAGGFFHYRGCPWPRWNPMQG